MKKIISFLLLAAMVCLTEPAYAATLAECQILPENNIWNTPVDTMPVAANSAQMIANIGADVGLHADFGSGLWEGAKIGIPITLVSSVQELVQVSFTYEDESDPGPYPIPPDAAVEGEPNDGDRHVLVLDQDACKLYEMFYAQKQPDDSWLAGSGAVFDLSS
ncbi:MAG: hypothetical protein D3924_14335, partial [Candidatus Electrothrix sp. AR4]|nr:hypothetical protein [Candidatus Electrothrix sp. AR4]